MAVRTLTLELAQPALGLGLLNRLVDVGNIWETASIYIHHLPHKLLLSNAIYILIQMLLALETISIPKVLYFFILFKKNPSGN